MNTTQGDLSHMVNITDTLNHGVHFLDLPLAVDKHDIATAHRCSLTGRSELPLQHNQIAIDPDIPTWSKSPFWIAVKELRDEVVDGVEAFDQLVGVVEGDVFIVSCLHLNEAFGHIALAKYS